MLKGVGLSRQIENLSILKGVDIEVHKGRITGVISLDARETSTLLAVLSGHTVPSGGSVLLDGKNLEYGPVSGFFKRGIGIIPGVSRLVGDLSVYDALRLNLARYLRTRWGLPSHADTMAKIAPILSQFGFTHELKTLVKDLPWEERQKLAVIQCLLEEADYLLVEKVTSALSVNSIENFFFELRSRKERGCGILFVPDNPNQIIELCDDIVILRNGKDVFRRSVCELDVDEIYNIMNNTEYTINQAIDNKFNQFNSTLSDLESLVNRCLKVLGNFCALYQSFGLWTEKGVNRIAGSKYWNHTYCLCGIEMAETLLTRLRKKPAAEGMIDYDDTAWYYAKISEDPENLVYLLMRCDEEPKYPLSRIVRSMRTSLHILMDRLKEAEALKTREFEVFRLSQEMHIAENIQTSILPKTFELPGYSVGAYMETATEVGGDAFEIFPTPLGNFISIGDVSGHGLPSGIMTLLETAAFHGAVQTYIRHGMEASPDIIYDTVNKVLCLLNRDRIGSDKFMTKILLLEKNGTFIHAGSHLIGLYYNSKEKKVIQIGDMVNKTAYLGISEFIESSSSLGSFILDSDDALLLYTDGLIEARDSAGSFFGIDRVADLFVSLIDRDPKSILQAMRAAVFDFSLLGDIENNKGHFEDDVSMVLIRKNRH